MFVILADINLKSTADGGRKSPIMAERRYFPCPLFFDSVKELSAHGYDCRMHIDRDLWPGDSAKEVPIAFLCPEDVQPHLKVGVEFNMWEAGYIGRGRVVAMLNSTKWNFSNR